MLSIHIPFYNLVLLPFSSLIISAVEIVTSPVECRKKILSLTLEGKNIGFVPTMGALHQGHLELVRRARLVCDVVVVSIFVNRTQFNNKEDFEKYPKTFDNDVAKLRLSGCDIVFAPTDSDMYPGTPEVKITFPRFQKSMEGHYRPGHFEGVALIVSKLLHAVPAQKAFFGRKDWQQVLIIKQLVKDLHFDTEIISVPTVREPDGLAMSSRNQRLSETERSLAVIFSKSLYMAKEKLLGGDSIEETVSSVRQAFDRMPEVRLEYFEIGNRETLEPVQTVESNTPVSLFIAGYVGDVRLIDNIFLQEETE
ncbi:pantoate--beta-alanine ligase [uncultured Imperialibacter sp.]|uniref:pantoate--beta-alanine ligase n=1 Tax=uncultured Imperialibacter sp. TaxID=1672639 RepID=UPI0030D943E8